ncbi:MAG: CapA family protein, partial [Clostridia bacterium]|nr:CapA family protein [Clostridia bacterium]
ISKEANDLVNSFNYDRIDEFYAAAEKNIDAMKKGGADVIIFYMHWGEEYQLKENAHQDTIAQKLCDLGVDIIIGSHPHVIQPMALLTASGGDHKTICAYSMGNAVSNQRQEIMHPECTTGHTEDGMLLSFKIDKYSDGTAVISSFDVIPTWVNKYKGGSGYLYSIIPLDNRDAGAESGLSGTVLEKSRKS